MNAHPFTIFNPFRFGKQLLIVTLTSYILALDLSAMLVKHFELIQKCRELSIKSCNTREAPDREKGEKHQGNRYMVISASIETLLAYPHAQLYCFNTL